MKFAVVGLIALGVLAAICAAVLMATLTARSESAPAAEAQGEEQVEVLITTRNLPPMSMVDSMAVTTRKVPKSQVPEGALLNSVQVVGKVTTEGMVVSQPFTKNVFAREGKGVYLASAVPVGKRAMSITLTDWSGMAGLLYPGSVVDVLVSFKSLGGDRRDETEMKTTTLLQGCMVLAIGSQSVADDEYKDKNPGAMAQTGQMNFRMVTLLVDPKQAEILQLAMQSGSISLAMRNPQDSGHEARRLTRASEIAPGGGVAGAITAVDDDPFENNPPQVTSTAKIPLLDVIKNLGTGPQSPLEWETLIIRGKTSETRTFPMPEEKPSGAETSETDPHAEPAGAGAGA